MKSNRDPKVDEVATGPGPGPETTTTERPEGLSTSTSDAPKTVAKPPAPKNGDEAGKAAPKKAKLSKKAKAKAAEMKKAARAEERKAAKKAAKAAKAEAKKVAKQAARTATAEDKQARNPLSKKAYEKELARLQVELGKLQNYVRHEGLKIVILFEGRDAAGKGGAIKRIIQRLNPRICRVVALGTPTDREKSQWYFQRYVQYLPAAGEIVLFDRSWYNRAGVERVMGFCTEEEYQEFFRATPEFERTLVRSGITLIKYGASGIRVGKSTRLPAKSQGLGSGSGSIPMMRLWECGNLAFCSRFPHFHSPCSTATRFRHADGRRPPRLGEHRSGRPTGRPPGGTESTGRTRPATRAGSTHPKAGRASNTGSASATKSRSDGFTTGSATRPSGGSCPQWTPSPGPTG